MRGSRQRTSVVLLLILAAGLALAGSAAARGASEMGCCPAGVQSDCTWLGAGDCCPERPGAPAQTHAAAPAAAPGCELTLPAAIGTPATLPSRAPLGASAPRTLVLRL